MGIYLVGYGEGRGEGRRAEKRSEAGEVGRSSSLREDGKEGTQAGSGRKICLPRWVGVGGQGLSLKGTRDGTDHYT